MFKDLLIITNILWVLMGCVAIDYINELEIQLEQKQ